MTIELYMAPSSPPVRAVQMTAKALGVDLELKPVDVFNAEQKTPEFLKINPQHTVPVINDNGTIIWDSHAINAYLVTKYAKTDSLYPKDAAKRAVVDQRLHFDSGILFARVVQILRPMFFRRKKTIDQEDTDLFNEAYEFLENFLDRSKWIAGDSVTIADYSIYNSLGSANALVPIDTNKFPKLCSWYKNVGALPESDVTREGFKKSVDYINQLLEK